MLLGPCPLNKMSLFIPSFPHSLQTSYFFRLLSSWQSIAICFPWFFILVLFVFSPQLIRSFLSPSFFYFLLSITYQDPILHPRIGTVGVSLCHHVHNMTKSAAGEVAAGMENAGTSMAGCWLSTPPKLDLQTYQMEKPGISLLIPARGRKKLATGRYSL